VSCRLRLEVVQRKRRRSPPCGSRGRRVPDEGGTYQTFTLIRTDLAGQFLVGKLDVLFAEDAEELVDVQIEQSELGIGVPGKVEHDQTVAVADDALDAEVVDRRHLRRDVVVLEVFRHLGKPAAPPEAEEGTSGGGEGGERGCGGSGAAATAVMDVDNALSTHAECKATVLVEDSIA